MPTIGNGYIGATIYDDAIFLNGVYEGAGGRCNFQLFFVYYSVMNGNRGEGGVGPRLLGPQQESV